MAKWKTISLPAEILTEIQKFIEESPEYGYTSVADFVTTAIRAHVDYRKILERRERLYEKLGELS